MAKHGIRVYSKKNGKPGFSNLYTKFSHYPVESEMAALMVTREVAKNIRRDTKTNIRTRLGSTSGELYNSVYFRRRYRKLVTYEVGVGAEHAEYPEFGTGIYNMFGKGRTDAWVYKSDFDGQFYTTEGQKPVLFFNDALDKNISRYPKLLKVEVGRALR